MNITTEVMMKGVIAMVLAGGKGERLSPLTHRRPKPCVPFGGVYKIIDFALSNLFNSDIKKAYVLSQYRGYTMTKHIRDSWSQWTGRGEYVAAVSPETSADRHEWFQGTADAIHQYLHFFEHASEPHVAVLGGDHIYKMDFRKMLHAHLHSGACVTVASLAVPAAEASRFGVLVADEEGRVTEFVEKPAEPKPMPGSDLCYASMGIYIFCREKLIKYLVAGKREHEDLDFGRHVIPMMLADGCGVHAYNFSEATTEGMTPGEQGYWRDVGTVDSYFDASMDLISVSPKLNLYNYQWPILAAMPNLPPAKTVFSGRERIGQCLDSYASPGCIISGGTVCRSLLSPSCTVHSYATVEDSILFNKVDIGRGAQIRRAIIDKRVRIRPGDQIGYNHDHDRARGFTVTESGIVVVPNFVDQ